MSKLELLKAKMEDQIEELMNTVVQIDSLEKEGPGRNISDRAQVGAGMIFFHILLRSFWDRAVKHNLTQEQSCKLIEEIGNMTYKHYLNLYGFDSRKDITKPQKTTWKTKR